ncbi:tail fiber domain-containing protein [Flavobacterium facile]|uniref:tail fiber domain-containing protein n=1 Tax=Flavobacterium facile TaxID=2893174 RepID=UPI002E77658C|nr:tail fiber domain-containing protein [Flavobacterium sp. T-12]
MKRFTIKSAFLALFISVLGNSICNAQVGIGTVTPSGSLDITSTNDGLLIPRIALSATNVATVLTPTVSELVYNTFTSALGPNQVAPGYYYWNGTLWVPFSTGNLSDWSLTGNTGTTPVTNFIGTTDAVDLVTKTNNAERMRITAAGNVGLGITNPTGRLHLYEPTGTTLSSTAGTLVLEHGNSGGQSSILFPSNVNKGSDYGYIKYSDDGSGNGSTNENSLLEIGVQNDVVGGTFQDDIALMPSGNLGIGTTAPVAKLDIAATVTTTNSIVNATGSINDYLQFNVQNTSAGIQAQSGYSATANNGTATTGFAWIGINNSAFNFPTAYNIGVANDVSYVGSGQDMHIANANNTKSIIFSTGRATTPFFNERMRLTNSGNLGIGTSTPNAPLQFPNTIVNRKIVLWEDFNNDHQFFGLGINSNILRYQVSTTTNNHVFYAATSATTSNELMRVQGNGFVGIGNSPITKLDLTGIKSSGAGVGTGVGNDAPTQAIITGGSNGTSRFNDWPSGWGGGLSTYDIVGASTFFNTYVTRSDRNLKRDIKSIDDKLLTNFMQLRPVTYYMKEELTETKGLHYGFIAQEVRELFPSIVTQTSDPNGIIGMNYQALIAPTIYAVQNQVKEIEILTQITKQQNIEIKDLESKLSYFENELKTLKELLKK